MTSRALGGTWLLAVGLLLTSAGCLRTSLFETSLDEDQRDQTRKNLERLGATPPPGGQLKLVFISDPHERFEELYSIVDWVNAQGDISLVLLGGDVTTFGARQEFVWAHEMLSRLQVPWFVAPGNHDLLTAGPDLYEKMFGPRNFAFDWAGYRFVLFDTSPLELDRRHLPLAWLREQLEGMPDGTRAVVFTHHPPDSRPHILPEEEPVYRQIQREGGVVLNLHGHIHSRYYVRRDGPTTQVNARTARHGHFVLVTLDGDAVTVQPCRQGIGCDAPTPAEPVDIDREWPP
ncbi:MAG TPA: metallophosphoesterase [Polyangiaceae bacterium]|nr:metallophosphoesterase [Polyangiaceae bacterium]